jgi:hypothetical protein
MKNLCILAAAIAMVASPALAESYKAEAQRGPQATSYVAYNGHKRHTDPDPNVRFEMMRQRNWRKG